MKPNCWEFKKCGREPGGAKVEQLGICLASRNAATDGVNSGDNGGRICWAVSGTLCGGKVQGTFARKIANCLIDCEFLKTVMREEGKTMFLYPPSAPAIRIPLTPLPAA
jgi:hypothetical protein